MSLARLQQAAVGISSSIPLEAACDLLLNELRADSSGDDVMLVVLEPTVLG